MSILGKTTCVAYKKTDAEMAMWITNAPGAMSVLPTELLSLS